jgi:hypothetical protein
MSPDLNPIQAREPSVQNIRQLEAALHREWQQLSQQEGFKSGLMAGQGTEVTASLRRYAVPALEQ